MLIVNIVITVYDYLRALSCLLCSYNNLLQLCLWEVIYKMSNILNPNFHSNIKWQKSSEGDEFLVAPIAVTHSSKVTFLERLWEIEWKITKENHFLHIGKTAGCN